MTERNFAQYVADIITEESTIIGRDGNKLFVLDDSQFYVITISKGKLVTDD